jgi:hypothetical protein
MADGHLNICKECTKLRIKKYRRDNPERSSAIDRAKYERTREKRIAYNLAYQRIHRTAERNRAHKLAQRLLRSKRLEFCEICHTRRVEHAHHPDYKKPLEVAWLCARCHQRLHHETVISV